jgi:acyl-coenzyme A synthetase/AMP-(fatty) acid ligase
MNTALKDFRNDMEAQGLLESLASGSQHRRQPFLVQGLTFAQLYCQADAVRNQLAPEMAKSLPICLYTDSRSKVTAALLAALSAGPPLLLPYAISGATLQEAQQSIPFTHALIEKDCTLPAGIKALAWPATPEETACGGAPGCIAWDSPWLYLFTGGSTGTPRVWSKTPRNLIMEAAYLARAFKVTSSDIILATVPANHIYGLLYSILLPLVSGASVNVISPTYPSEILQCLEKTSATILVSIPAHYRALRETPIAHHHVRTAFSSAGALAEQDGLDFYNATGIAITEIYGSTETGGIAQRTRAKGETAFQPFDCVQVQINNEHLCVRSDFLSRELDRSDQGFFETADRAAWAETSGFVVLGRSDGIIKVGGKRVDLAKTRETLMHVEGVGDVYVFAIPVQSGRENEIVALVQGQANVNQLVQAANLNLPPYARPRTIKLTRQIPLTPTGKYNRDAIRKLFEPNS